eukprot:10996160-Alexandrium_andersonii.AAC.1
MCIRDRCLSVRLSVCESGVPGARSVPSQSRRIGALVSPRSDLTATSRARPRGCWLKPLSAEKG